MSQSGDGPPAVPPVTARQQVGWPTTPPPHRTLRPGDPTAVGPYRLEAVLGEGGMGRVWLGRTLAGSAVAVKLVHREYAADPAFRKRFAQEVATARRVQGLYTVPVVDADVQADEPWLATAYIPGPSLQYAVTEHGPLPVEVTLALIARVAEALQSIHDAGVIHRDFKPSNVILTTDGPKVIDFGIARAADATSVTETGVQPGTPAYMAPEQILGHALTPAADVFALGVLAHFAATGELAFGGGAAPAVIHRIVEGEPNLDGCPEPIRAIATACLTKDPQERPTPAEIIQWRRQDSVSESGGRTAPSLPPPPSGIGTPPPADAPTEVMPPSLSRRHSLLIAGAVGAAGLGGLYGLFRAANSTSPPPRPQPRPPQGDPLGDNESYTPTNVTGVAFSPDGKTLACSTEQVITLWDVLGRRQLATLAKGVYSGISGLAFSLDGRSLATAGEEQVTLWDVARRKAVGTLRGRVDRVAFGRDGRTLAAAYGQEDSVTLWDVARRRRIVTLSGREIREKDDRFAVGTVAFSPDGRTLSAAFGNPEIENSVTLWDLAGRRQIATLTGRDSGSFSPDSRILAVASREKDAVMLWDLAHHRQLTTLVDRDRIAGPFQTVTFSPDGKTLAASGANAYRATLTLWDVADRRPITTWDLSTDSREHPNGSVQSMAFSPDGRTLATGSNSGLYLWDVAQALGN
ncbi:WD40 repeat domain-containing serine/threonine protein kinase [Actinomadura sp. 1N219]|uniref:WD40 repeat domain-containing serine/threonine protein kinase n=1 Tax=Actinomadura sp. 1N219 TaxID=3375152 RepID=UPI00378E043E